MTDFSKLNIRHPIAEKIVDIIIKKTQTHEPAFFRIMVSYYMAKMAAMMQAQIITKDRGHIPVNLYAINLGCSGLGKNYSVNIVEDHVINQFKSTFYDETFPIVSNNNLAQLASDRSLINDVDEDTMFRAVKREFEEAGVLPFSFDSGTTAAVKQSRHKLLMSDIGSLNFEMDEIGSNLLGNTEVLNTFLELFDVGKTKQKLIKNTRENIRTEEIEGKTPTNLLLFGVPVKVLDGSKIEEQFISFLDIGYARRAIFGFVPSYTKDDDLPPEEIYKILTNTDVEGELRDISNYFGSLADVLSHKKKIVVSKEISIELIKYRKTCDKIANAMPKHAGIQKTEIAHRYFKALKLAGAYAFIDDDDEITMDNLHAAICIVEDSGKAFKKILKRDKNYVKLAKYIAEIAHEVTHVDLGEELTFYKGSMTQKQELLNLATAWGYKNKIMIKRNFVQGIEFISGEKLIPTDLKKLRLSYSQELATNYENVTRANFFDLHELVTLDNYNWLNHCCRNGKRKEQYIDEGFNMIVLDIDNGTSLYQIDLLLKDYTYMWHVTKSHTKEKHRFRLILPINYNIKLKDEEYKEFMTNIYKWLPVEIQADTQTGQRSRKWSTNYKCAYKYNKGTELVDALLFIPNTNKNNEYKKLTQSYQSLTNLERWFIQNTSNGNRNTKLLRYAFILVDLGKNRADIHEALHDLNDKLADKLPRAEIDHTIMKSVLKKIK
jgi:hypothetical protein